MKSPTGERASPLTMPFPPFHTQFVEVFNGPSSLTFVPRPTASMKMEILSLIPY